MSKDEIYIGDYNLDPPEDESDEEEEDDDYDGWPDDEPDDSDRIDFPEHY